MRSSHLTRGYKEIMYMALAVVATSTWQEGVDDEVVSSYTWL
jgi:hypothetical protein